MNDEKQPSLIQLANYCEARETSVLLLPGLCYLKSSTGSRVELQANYELSQDAN